MRQLLFSKFRTFPKVGGNQVSLIEFLQPKPQKIWPGSNYVWPFPIYRKWAHKLLIAINIRTFIIPTKWNSPIYIESFWKLIIFLWYFWYAVFLPPETKFEVEFLKFSPWTSNHSSFFGRWSGPNVGMAQPFGRLGAKSLIVEYYFSLSWIFNNNC